MLREDVDGRASFAVTALVILLLANVSVVYAVVVQRNAVEMAIQANEIRTLGELSEVIDNQVETAAHFMAMQSIRDATSGLHNQSEINERLREAFSGFIDRTFPRQFRGHVVSVDDHEIIVVTGSRIVNDVLLTGTEAHERDGESPDAIQTGVPSAPQDAERIVYYRLMGFINYTLQGEHASLRTRGEISSDLESPYPFIHQQMERMAASGIGAASDIEEMLRYMLTTVAQQRILLGFGGGIYGKPTMGTHDVLTAQDVEMAVNVALILEQLRQFRDIDEDSLRSFDASYFSEYAGGVSSPVLSPPSGQRSLSRLIGGYVGKGTLDPADIFELFTAVDKESVQMNMVLAQALYAMADQYVLKYLDYIDFLPLEFLADLGLNFLELAANAWDDFVSWLTGNSKEAEMVRQFVTGLFLDLGYSPLVLSTVVQAVPAKYFLVTNLDGTKYNISTPAGNASIPFPPRSITEGNADLWKAYYNDVFRNDLNRLHSGVRDLALDVARKLADNLEVAGLFRPIVLNGEINQFDNVSVLEYTRDRMIESVEDALTALRSDPQIFSKLVGNLWEAEKQAIRKIIDCIELNYDAFAKPAISVAFGRDRLRDWFIAKAKSDADYTHLDPTALEELRTDVIGAIDSGGWAQSAYDTAKRLDTARFESLYQKAVDLNTPPEGGGLYKKLMESLTGTTGLLLRAGGFVLRFMEGLMTNEELSDNKVLIPASTLPFVFKDSLDGVPGSSQEETFEVDQSPDLLTITSLSRGQGAVVDFPQEGGLFVDILDPSEIAATKESPNTHFTDASNTSARPFESQWTISLRGVFRMKVSTSRGVYLDATGLVPVTDEALVPLDIVVRVKTYSGWPLDGVSYASSSTLGKDLWNAVSGFLDRVWKAASAIYSWILDGVKFIIHQLRSLADFLISQAAKILEGIHHGIDRAIHLMQEALKGVMAHFMEALDRLLSDIPRFEMSFSVLGLALNVCVNCDPANRLMVRTGIGPLSIFVRFTNLRLAGYEPVQEWAKWDVLVDFDANAGPLKVHAEIDPLMLVNGFILSGSGTWGDKWRFDFEGPVMEQYYSYSKSVGFFIPLPFGLEADFELGFDLKSREPLAGIDIPSMLQQSFRESWDTCGGMPYSIEDFRGCVGIFVTSFTDRVLESMDREIHKISEVTIYVKGGVGVLDVVDGGMTLEVTVEGEGIVALFHWLARNIRGIVQRLFNPNTELHLEQIPLDVLRHIYIYVGFYVTVGPPYMLAELFPDGFKPEVTMTWLIGANIPFAAALLGMDLGPWEIRFGVVIEGPSGIQGLFSGTPGMVTDLWAIQGSVVPI